MRNQRLNETGKVVPGVNSISLASTSSQNQILSQAKLRPRLANAANQKTRNVARQSTKSLRLSGLNLQVTSEDSQAFPIDSRGKSARA